MKNRFFTVLFLLSMAFAANVQAVTNYSCDFEDAAARARWHLNPTANTSIYNQLKNKWYLGAPGNHAPNGQYGLYISDDEGQTAHYTNRGCWVFAYDIVTLDYMETDDYTLVFDYTVMGNVASNYDGLYVLWIPMTAPGTSDSTHVFSIPTYTGTIPSAYEEYVLTLQPTAGMDYLNGTAIWKQCAARIKGKKCDGTPHYLAFVWANGTNQAQQPGAMVDNIYISASIPCQAPTDLHVETMGTTVSLQWTGNAAEYEVSAYSYDADQWYGPKMVTGTATTFANLPVGQTDFIVRAKCTSTEYSLKTIVSKLIYYPDMMCVDYLNIDNAVCYVANSQPTDTRTFDDFIQVPAIDYGPSDSRSRHTVHFDRTETDPRTGGLAKTIPDGELASVRLGNWETAQGEGAEQIEFTFPIDTFKYPVLLLKYLPVIEAPSHSDYENSRFTMDILVDSVKIGQCGQADFNANDAYNRSTQQLKPGAEAQGWHLYNATGMSARPVVWKDWTTVGVNLRDYARYGHTVTVRLATFDCVYNAHYGYAYFTLGCSDGKFKGMKCGEINTDFEAPDGFKYRWIDAKNERYRGWDGAIPEQYVVSREQAFHVGTNDTAHYVVDCMFVQDTTCYFSLYATSKPTEPVAAMNEPILVENEDGTCSVSFDASPSFVRETNQLTGQTSASTITYIDSYEWYINDLPGPYNWSEEVSPTFNFPSAEGEYDVTLRVASGVCESTMHYRLQFTYNINVTADPNQGSVEVQQIARNTYELTAIPNDHYHFLRWSDGNLENPRTITLTQDATLTAYFEHHEVYVTYLDADGTILGAESVSYGGNATAAGINPDKFGYTFLGWDKPLTNITEDITVYATYRRDAVNGFYYIYDRAAMTAILDHEGDSYKQMKVLNVPNRFIYRGQTFAVTAVGAYAFEGCDRLTDVVVPSNVEYIRESAFSGCSDMIRLTVSANLRGIDDYAFQGCKRLEEITVYAERVPDLTATSFANVGNKKYINVYVPDNRVNQYKRDEYWSEFNIVVKSAETITENVEDVTVEPEESTAQFTWPTESNAGSYTIVISKDGVVFCTLIFNANGQLTGIAFAPGRDGNNAPAAVLTSNGGMQFTVTGLDAGTHYGYTVTTKDNNDRVLATYEGEFDTTGSLEDGIEEIMVNGEGMNGKFLMNGQIFILRNGKLYTVTGQAIQ